MGQVVDRRLVEIGEPAPDLGQRQVLPLEPADDAETIEMVVAGWPTPGRRPLAR